jgi:hypothetical protein
VLVAGPGASPSRDGHNRPATCSPPLLARWPHLLTCTFQAPQALFAVDWWTPSTTDVAAPDPPVRVGPEPPLKLHEAPDPGAVDSDVGLDVRRGLADSGQVDAE